MKVQIELVENLQEPIVTIRCANLDSKVTTLQQKISEICEQKPQILFYRDTKEYYFDVQDILFFETESNNVYAHTKDDVYRVKWKLYELETILPHQFLRISKSTIINSQHVFSIDRSFPSYHLVQFYKSHKQVYVSRMYFQPLKHKLEKRRVS